MPYSHKECAKKTCSFKGGALGFDDRPAAKQVPVPAASADETKDQKDARKKLAEDKNKVCSAVTKDCKVSCACFIVFVDKNGNDVGIWAGDGNATNPEQAGGHGPTEDKTGQPTGELTFGADARSGLTKADYDSKLKNAPAGGKFLPVCFEIYTKIDIDKAVAAITDKDPKIKAAKVKAEKEKLGLPKPA